MNPIYQQHSARPQTSMRAADQSTTELTKDVNHRELLKATLVIWGGEFGGTLVAQVSKNSTVVITTHTALRCSERVAAQHRT